MRPCRTIGMIGMIGMVGALVGCGPVVGGDGTAGADGTSTAPSSETQSSGASISGPVTSSGADTTDDTGPTARRCFDSVIVTPSGHYARAVRLRVDAPMRLLFALVDDRTPINTQVVGAESIEGPWEILDTLPGVVPLDHGDIDGDGADDVIMRADDPQWWGPDAEGTLVERAPFADDGDRDALFQLRGDAFAGRAYADGDLAIARGNGDGTFATPVITPRPSPEIDLGLPVDALGEGFIAAQLYPLDCATFCAGKQVMQISTDGTALAVVLTEQDEKIAGLGDIEPDGVLDLFTRTPDNVVQVYRGPLFDQAEPLFDDVLDAAVGDIDGDGASDVAVKDADGVSVRWNDGGSFAVASLVDPSAPAYQSFDDVIDLDGDGTAEILAGVDDDAYTVVRAIDCGG